MLITVDVIIKAAALIGALAALVAPAYKVIRWVKLQEEQSIAIEKLRKKESKDIKMMREEQCIINYALLACLDGLKQKGCNGAVTEAYNRMQKHLNQMAHTDDSEE